MTSRFVQGALLITIIGLLTGCASLMPETCEQFEQSRKTTNYATTYKLETTLTERDVKPLTKKEMAAVQHYRMSLNTEKIRPCSHIKIQKELTLIRRDDPTLIFEETREFFADDGTRIATKTETITNQLLLSGRYSAYVPLPIPKNAPPGKYRLVTTLTLKTKGSKKPLTLAQTHATFQVVGTSK